MKVQIYITRDVRNGEPLNIERDGYRYESQEIPVEVELDCKFEEWEILNVKLLRDPFELIYCAEEKTEVFLPFVLKYYGVTLTNEEFQEAVEEAKRQHEAWLAEQWGYRV